MYTKYTGIAICIMQREYTNAKVIMQYAYGRKYTILY